MTERTEVTGNRAVSALFRVFGGAGRREIADGFERTSFGAMHEKERLILGWVVPLTVFAALSEALMRALGAVAGWVLLPPIGFFFLTVMAYLVPGRKAAVQWWSWLLLLTVWGWWRRDAAGYVAVFAWFWLGMFALNALAHLLLAFLSTMKLGGRAGIAWRMGLFLGLHVLAFIAHWSWGWTWSILSGLSISSVYCAAVLHPSRQWLGPVKCRNEAGPVLVTIDDGPCPEETPQLLDLLDRHQMKAVFFMIGEKVRKHPEIAKEVARRGHEIGNHTMTHPQASFWCAGPRRTRKEIASCQEAIREVTGVTPTKFRAPVGHRNLFTHPIAGELGLQVVAWNRRGFDAVVKDSEKVLRQILPLSGGDIVLMHEGTGIAKEVLSGILEKR